MNNILKLLAVTTFLATVAIAGPVFSAAAVQTVVLTQVDPVILAKGWRASAIMGATVYNDAGEDIGKVDDMIITMEDTVPFAVLSVGGFLGMNDQKVVVAASALELVGEKLTLHGGTLESLKALPNFVYAK